MKIIDLKIRTKLTCMVGATLAASMLGASFTNNLLSTDVISERVMTLELPETVGHIKSDIENVVLPPAEASSMLASNPHIQNWIRSGEPADGVDEVITTLSRAKAVLGSDTAFLATTEKRSDYTFEGFSQRFAPNAISHDWFYKQLNAGQALSINVGQDNTGTMRLYINAIIGGSEKLGITGFGFNIESMVQMLQNFKIGETGFVYLVDKDAVVRVHPDDNEVNNASLRDYYEASEVNQFMKSNEHAEVSRVERDGVGYLVASAYIPSLDWYLLAEVPESEVFAGIEKANMISTGVSLAIGLLALVMGAMFINTIAKPIARVAQMLQEIGSGEGNLRTRLEVKSKDEVGELSEGFNQFVSKIHEVVKLVAATSSCQVEKADEVKNLAEMGLTASEEQTAQTDQLATAVTQMTSTVQEIAGNASQAATAANDANAQAMEGQQVVESSTSTIQNLSAQLDDATLTIGNVSEHSNQIGNILTVIKEISDQTNLLALNAAIEAARAGDQGRGFAVVADEVRQLAKRTADSTEEIQAMIEQLQSQTANAVNTITEGKELGEQSVVAVQQLGGAFNEIVNAVQAINDMNIQVATATEEQTVVTGEISKNTQAINEATQVNTQASHSTAVALEELNQLTAELRNQVSKFKI